MKLSVIASFYNEELIAPYFLKHYFNDNNIDKLYALVDTDTTDNTIKILSGYKNVEIIDIVYPDGFSDILKVKKINEVYKTISEGWVITVDSDEFVFSLNGSIQNFILTNSVNSHTVIRSELWHPYRNKVDNDLDVNLAPIVNQRRYGIQQNKWGSLYTKPIVAQSGLDIRWQPGQHIVEGYPTICPKNLNGVHWQYADHSIVLNRHTRNRKDRLSQENIDNGYSLHFLDYTEEVVLKECNEHLDDGELFCKI
jgi:hypothetical protein